MRFSAIGLALGLVLATTLAACGGPDTSSADATSASAAAAQATFTGNLTVSATSVAAGTPFKVTESATNLTATHIGFITVGIRRLGFSVVAAQKPPTGICRIAGSAVCTSLLLQPFQTQAYTLTLVGNTPGTYTIQGWTDSPYVSGGFSGSVTVTVQ